jgi:hypothetical protein
MYSIVAHPQTPASVPKFQVLLDKMLIIRADDKLRLGLSPVVGNAPVEPG